MLQCDATSRLKPPCRDPALPSRDTIKDIQVHSLSLVEALDVANPSMRRKPYAKSAQLGRSKRIEGMRNLL